MDSSPYVIKNPALFRGKWKHADRPLCLEIGTGKGRFIIETALANPDTDYLGMERYESVLFRACERMEGIPYKTPMDKIEYERSAADGKTVLENASDPAASSNIEITDRPDRSHPPLPVPKNLHFLRNDAREITDIFAPGELDRIYLNFSDPWPKARHAKRRLTSHEFLARYEQCLKDGGCLEFKTDNTDLFNFSLEEIKSAPHWELTAMTRDLHRDPVLSAGNIMTEYERKFSALGNKICKLIAVYHKTPITHRAAPAARHG